MATTHINATNFIDGDNIGVSYDKFIGTINELEAWIVNIDKMSNTRLSEKIQKIIAFTKSMIPLE